MTGHGNIELAVRAMKSGRLIFLPNRFKSSWSGWRCPDCWNSTGCDRKTPCSPHVDSLRQYSLPVPCRWRISVAAIGRLELKISPSLNGVSRKGKSVRPSGWLRARQREQSLVASLMTRLEETWQSLHETVEEEIASLSFMIAHKVVRDVVTEKRDLIVTQVRTALAHLHESGLVRVRVHPSDLTVLEAARTALSQTPHGLLTLKFETDPSIGPGGASSRRRAC